MKNGKVDRIYPNTKTRRLFHRVKAGNFLKVYFKVEYGKAKTESGKEEMFYNDGEYTDPKEAYRALKAFLEL